MIGFKKGSRINILAGFLFVAMAIIVLRLFQIQIIDHQKYLEMAHNEYVKSLTIPARRGQIYALDGDSPVPLVMNETVYTVFVDPQIVSDAGKVTDVIKKIAGGNLTTDITEALGQKDSRYQIVAKNLTRVQAEMIKSENLSGVGFHETARRVYPENGLASQVLGFVNAEGAGQYGIEGDLNNRLKGKDGRLQTVTDVNLVPLTIGDKNTEVPAEDGDNLVLTVDRNIQAYSEQALKRGMENVGAEKGSVVVMNPQTGQILAMSSFPTYNVADYETVTDVSLFANPIVTDPYEPGSVIKAFTMATGLDKGVITPSSTYYNRDYITVDDRVIGNAHLGLIGEISMQTVLDYSLNTGVVTVLERFNGNQDKIDRADRDTLYEYFHDKFRFGKETGVEVYEELGQIISPEEVEGNAVRYSNMTFGQGMNITMLQVVSAFSSLVNGGTYHQPTVVAGLMEDGIFIPDTSKPSQNIISSATSDTIKNMLISARCTIYCVKDTPGYQIGGKTGTSETLEGGSYIKSTTIASYLGFGGKTSPEYAIMVRVWASGSPLEGGKAAEPIFNDISNYTAGYLNQ